MTFISMVTSYNLLSVPQGSSAHTFKLLMLSRCYLKGKVLASFIGASSSSTHTSYVLALSD
jgi:hypothetical protein